MGNQTIETKWIYSVSFLMKDTEDNLQMNLTTGFADADYFVNQITDYSNKINKDSIVAINSNFIKYVNSKEDISFEINLNTNDIKTKKMIDFKNELIAKFIERTKDGMTIEKIARDCRRFGTTPEIYRINKKLIENLGIEILEPIESDIFLKDIDTFLKSIENGKFIVANGVIGSGQEYLIQNLAKKTNRLAVSVDLEYIQDRTKMNLSDSLSYFVDSITDINKDLIFLIKRNKIVANDIDRIENIKKTFEENVFKKLNAVVFYMIMQ